VGNCFRSCVSIVWRGVNISLAQESKVDLTALTQETQKISQKADEMTLIWWIPEEFWQISFAQDPTATEAQSEEFIKILHPYTLIAVVDGKVGSFGGVTYRSEADIRPILTLEIARGLTICHLMKMKLMPMSRISYQ